MGHHTFVQFGSEDNDLTFIWTNKDRWSYCVCELKGGMIKIKVQLEFTTISLRFVKNIPPNDNSQKQIITNSVNIVKCNSKFRRFKFHD